MSAKVAFKVLLGVLLVSVLLTAAWYKADRPGLLGLACEAGLPNFSRPEAIPEHMIGCTIVGPKQKFTGVLTNPRELFVAHVLKVGPPPPELVQEWVDAYRKQGMCDK